jgi:hypothetical protein
MTFKIMKINDTVWIISRDHQECTCVRPGILIEKKDLWTVELFDEVVHKTRIRYPAQVFKTMEDAEAELKFETDITILRRSGHK